MREHGRAVILRDVHASRAREEVDHEHATSRLLLSGDAEVICDGPEKHAILLRWSPARK